MKQKLRLMILLSSLLIVPSIFIFASTTKGEKKVEKSSMYCERSQRHRHKVHTCIKNDRKHNQRSTLSSYGYVEENTLYLYFNSPLEDVSLEVTNAETGTLIFSGTFTGSSLVIPLQEDGYEFNINVN